MVECGVIPGTYGVFVQCLLFTCCIAVLVFKKKRESVSRTWIEFGLDSSKQLIGAGWIHVMNLGAALVLGHRMSAGDECEWYWVNIMIDTTLGVAVEYALLQLISKYIELHRHDAADFRTGEYMNAGKLDFERYTKQLVVWLMVVTGMKILMVFLMVTFASMLQGVAATVLAPVADSPRVKLLIVMILTPLLMNSFQLWVVDNFIRSQKHEIVHHCADAEEMEEAARRPGRFDDGASDV